MLPRGDTHPAAAGHDALLVYDGIYPVFGVGGVAALWGWLGIEILHVDNAGDTVTEAAGQGTDRVYSAVSYALAAGDSIETLSTTHPVSYTHITLPTKDLTKT